MLNIHTDFDLHIKFETQRNGLTLTFIGWAMPKAKLFQGVKPPSYYHRLLSYIKCYDAKLKHYQFTGTQTDMHTNKEK